ncbi:sporulation protein YunB [Oscillospiraceae bacterium PP1C4]
MKGITIRISKKKLRALKMLFSGVAIIVCILALDSRIRPVMTTLSTYQAKLAATKSINDAVIDVISQEDVVYNNIISLTKGETGEVSSISTDMITINRLKAEITNKVSDRLKQDASRSIYIPLGTILGGQFLSGRGPKVEFKVLPAGYVKTEIYNSFQSAGINQTLHQIMLSVNATVSAVAPVYTITTDVNTNICITETIIVGKVPNAFTDINGDKADPIGLYNDYAAHLVDPDTTS